MCKTDVGLKREHNEDSYLYDEEMGLYCVADGMGGHQGGEVASAMAVQTLSEFVRDAKAQSRRYGARELIVRGYENASAKIYDKSHLENQELQGMGTTLVTAMVSGDSLFIGNVGDSRAYLYSQDRLWQLTEDHSLVNEQLKAGLIKEEDIPRLTTRNVITRSVGFEREVEVDVIERALQTGDMYLMCSDGLCGLVDDSEILELVRQHGLDKVEHIVDDCIDAAKAAGGDDNITVMILTITD